MAKRIVSAKIIINKPALDVFKFICDIEYYPLWSDLAAVKKLTGTGEVGTIYELTKGTLLGKESAPVEISQKLTPLHFAFQDKSKDFVSEFGFRLRDMGEATEVTAYHEAQIMFFSGFFASNVLTGANTEVSLKAVLKKLKAAIEV